MESLEGMSEGLHKARSGLIRALVKVEAGRIRGLIISGDFIIVPESSIDMMEASLIGSSITEEEIIAKLRRFFETNAFQSPGASPEDFALAIMKAVAGGKKHG
jgi:lipoate-protein ligase A